MCVCVCPACLCVCVTDVEDSTQITHIRSRVPSVPCCSYLYHTTLQWYVVMGFLCHILFSRPLFPNYCCVRVWYACKGKHGNPLVSPAIEGGGVFSVLKTYLPELLSTTRQVIPFLYMALVLHVEESFLSGQLPRSCYVPNCSHQHAMKSAAIIVEHEVLTEHWQL